MITITTPLSMLIYVGHFLNIPSYVMRVTCIKPENKWTQNYPAVK